MLIVQMLLDVGADANTYLLSSISSSCGLRLALSVTENIQGSHPVSATNTSAATWLLSFFTISHRHWSPLWVLMSWNSSDAFSNASDWYVTEPNANYSLLSCLYFGYCSQDWSQLECALSRGSVAFQNHNRANFQSKNVSSSAPSSDSVINQPFEPKAREMWEIDRLSDWAASRSMAIARVFWPYKETSNMQVLASTISQAYLITIDLALGL